jgi:hypothetical protein
MPSRDNFEINDEDALAALAGYEQESWASFESFSPISMTHDQVVVPEE